MTDSRRDEPGQRPNPEPIEGGSSEDLLEEITGFNFRSLRTLRDLVLRPDQVFAAYAGGERTYTPALRLWLSLAVVLTVITYFFGGPEDLFFNAYNNWPDAHQDRISAQIDGGLETLAVTQGEIYGVLHPIASGLASGTALLLVALLSGPIRWASRLNVTFAMTTLGAAAALVTLPFMVRRPDLSLIMIPLIVVVYAVTFWRGAPGLGPRAASWRIIKAGLIAIYISLANFAVGVALYVFSLNWAFTRLGVGTGPAG